jgi:hypothetical protein
MAVLSSIFYPVLLSNFKKNFAHPAAKGDPAYHVIS